MRKSFYILSSILIACIFACQPVMAKTVKNVRQQRQNTQREIKETSRKLDKNAKQVERQLNQYNLITADIADNEKAIRKLNDSIRIIRNKIAKINDTIKIYDNQLESLRENYTKAIKKMRSKRADSNKLFFIFSANSFKQAARRIRYLKQFSRWRESQSTKIKDLISDLDSKRKKLDELTNSQKQALAELKSSQSDLKVKKEEQSGIVEGLKKEGSSLKKLLKEKERLAKKLDDELERLIAEEERKAAERARIAEEKRKAEERRIAEEKRKEEERRLAEQKKKEEQEAANKKNKVKPEDKKQKPQPPKKEESKPEPPKKEEQKVKPSNKREGYIMDENEEKLAGSFEDNKGKLKSPVSAPYKIVKPFGRHRHPELRHVETNNGGIDIETTSGADACAVFNGTVSVVFKTDGFNIAVMVRHGNYLTVYVNLENTYVRAGDKVIAGQAIGKVYSDPDDDNRTILHFEIRKEKEKLNPAKWIR